MTVCIAAVCNVIEGAAPSIITASDRMLTIGDLEYEPAQTKTVVLASQTVALCAGDMQLHVGILPRVHERIKDELADNPANINVSRIADIYAEEFAYHRRKLAEREILIPRGLDFDRFLARQATMAHYQVEKLGDRLELYHIDATAIIAGIDPTGSHIYKVSNPGVSVCWDAPFFACAGSGEGLATSQFMLAKYDKTWLAERALWLTFTAKARAERAGGVGPQTDLVVIGPGGVIFPITEAHKKRLYEIFEETLAKEAALTREAESNVEAYIKSITSERSDQRQTAAHPAQTAVEPPSADQSSHERKGT